MAFKKTVQYRGITIIDAYWSIEEITVIGSSMTFSVGFRAAESLPLINAYNHACNYDVNGSSPIDQAYAYLKTLAEFSEVVGD